MAARTDHRRRRASSASSPVSFNARWASADTDARDGYPAVQHRLARLGRDRCCRMRPAATKAAPWPKLIHQVARCAARFYGAGAGARAGFAAGIHALASSTTATSLLTTFPTSPRRSSRSPTRSTPRSRRRSTRASAISRRPTITAMPTTRGGVRSGQHHVVGCRRHGGGAEIHRRQQPADDNPQHQDNDRPAMGRALSEHRRRHQRAGDGHGAVPERHPGQHRGAGGRSRATASPAYRKSC